MSSSFGTRDPRRTCLSFNCLLPIFFTLSHPLPLLGSVFGINHGSTLFILFSNMDLLRHPILDTALIEPNTVMASIFATHCLRRSVQTKHTSIPSLLNSAFVDHADPYSGLVSSSPGVPPQPEVSADAFNVPIHHRSGHWFYKHISSTEYYINHLKRRLELPIISSGMVILNHTY